jgi:hypothetical protein
MSDQAATPSGNAGAGQAASAQQGAGSATGQSAPQSGQGQTTGQGQQGDGSGTAQQTGTTTATAAATTTTADAPPTATVPERYELRLPEQSLLDQSDIDVVANLAKTKGWTNEQAQAALTEMHTTLSEQATRFRAELDADPEVGGAHLEQAQMFALRALDRFFPASEEDGKAFRHVMNKSGWGNNRLLVKFLSRIGKAMSEDQPGSGATGRVFTQSTRSQADRLFGDASGIRPPT